MVQENKCERNGNSKMNKRGVELSINTIVIIIIAIIVLIVLILIFTGSMKDVIAELSAKIKSVFGLWKSSQIS